MELNPDRPSRAEAAAQRLLARALDAAKPARLVARGRCMQPLIRDGDWVEIRPGEPRRGDVVLARTSTGDLVCHRVLRRSAGTFRLAGDRSLETREHSRDSLLGAVRSVERGGLKLPLGGWWMRRLDGLQIGLRRLSSSRERPLGRAVEACRRLLLRGYEVFWRLKRAARHASRAGASRRLGPASSR